MKSILKNISLDFLTGLIAITIIFVFVEIIPVSRETLVLIVGIVYLTGGLIRGNDQYIPLIVKIFIISLFGIIYIPLIGENYTLTNIPYPTTGIVFTLIGLLTRRYWPSISTVKRLLSISLPILILYFLSVFILPGYFDFSLTYASGPAPDFELQTLDGKEISSDELKGKIILLDFWDTHCGPCIRLMPQNEKLYMKYKDNPDVAIIIVNAGWESLDKAKEFVSKKKFNLPFSYMDIETSRSMNVFELPTTIIIDKKYHYNFKHVGFNPSRDAHLIDDIDYRIQQLLSGS